MSKDQDSLAEEELFLKFHEMSMNSDTHIAALGRMLKDIMPAVQARMADEFERGTKKADMFYTVIAVMTSMCLLLMYKMNKAQRVHLANGIINIFSEKLRSAVVDENFPEM